MKILYTNTESLLSKIDELKKLTCDLKPDLILLSETWIKGDTPEGLYHIPGYNFFMHCNENEQRGGAMIYARTELQVERHEQMMNLEMKNAIWVKLKIPESRREVTVGTVYRKSSRGKRQDDRLLKCFDRINPTSEVVVCGDFNLPKIDWENGVVRDTPDSATQRIYSKLEDRGLVQLVRKATRQRGNDEPSLLDWIIVSREENVEDVQHMAPLGAGDHDVLLFTYRVNIRVPIRTRRRMFDFRLADFPSLLRTLKNESWEGVYGSDEVNKQLKYFTYVYNEMARRVPTKPVREPEDQQKPPWWNGRAERALKSKHFAWKRYNDRGKTRKLHLEYVKARRKADTAVKNAKFQFEKRLAKHSKQNKKAFYRYANSKLRTTTPIMNMKVDGKMTQDEAKICDTMRSFFTSVHTDETDLEELFLSDFFENISKNEEDDIASKLGEVEISEEDVLEGLKRLNPFKSVGPDEIHPRILKELATEFYRPLTHIFRTSMRTGVVPEAWKSANVVPIFKKGLRTSPENYRPVSLTSCLGKLLEKIIRRKLMEHLESQVLIDEQHGFRARKSCATNLLCCMEDWTKWLDEGSNFDVLYLDFKKAFDLVPHQRLLSKLWSQGIGGDLLVWFTNFLTGRTQRVKINSTVSRPSIVRSGIPQGSVLGPVFFIAYINDILLNVTHATGSIFADDTKLYAKVNTIEDGMRLQNDLREGPAAWAHENLMSFNANKCNVVHYGRNNPRCTYELNGVLIQPAKEQTDLGVLFVEDMSFSKHIANKTKKANSVLGIIHKTFSYKALPIMKDLYIGLVRPHLEYSVQAWSPYWKKDITKLEGVQRRATKRIPELRGKDYEDRLEVLNLTTLEERRVRGDAIETFKMLSGLENVAYEQFFQLNTTEYRLRRHSKTLFKEHTRLEVRKNFFSNRVVNNWNGLTEDVVSATSVNCFKNRYDKLVNEQ